MISVSARTVTLRPIKFAFLVNPLESQELDRAIETSLFLWGGLHNPIIPIYRCGAAAKPT
jgi:hypothetical protein